MTRLEASAAGRRPTEARIDLGAIRANYAEARRRAGGRSLYAVIKADAYGHGAVRGRARARRPGLRAARRPRRGRGGAARRRRCSARACSCSAACTTRRRRPRRVARGFVPVLHDAAGLALVAAAARAAGVRAPVQVEVDTGMRRMGDRAGRRAGAARPRWSRSRRSRSRAPSRTSRGRRDGSRALRWRSSRRFRDALARARARGVAPGRVHFANSAALLAGAPARGRAARGACGAARACCSTACGRRRTCPARCARR